MCDGSVVPHISVYPGQAFKIIAVGMGVGISPAVARSEISDKYDIFLNFKVWEMHVNLSTTHSWLLGIYLGFVCS